MIADNTKHYRGYFDKGTSTGSMWVGSVLKPLKKYQGNFQVVSTDYDTYAIVYTCTPQTAMFDKEVIMVLARISPAIGDLPVDFEDKVRGEFDRIFGRHGPRLQEPTQDEDKFLNPEEETEQLRQAEEEPKL